MSLTTYNVPGLWPQLSHTWTQRKAEKPPLTPAGNNSHWVKARNAFFLTVFNSSGYCNKVHKLHSSKQQKFIPSQFWRLDVQNQGAGRARHPPRPLREDLPCPSSFWWLLAFLGLWQHHSNLYLCCHTTFLPWVLLCLCISSKFTSHIELGTPPPPPLHLFQYDLLTNNIRNNSISKSGHNLRFKEGHEFWRGTIQRSTLTRQKVMKYTCL